MIPTAAHKRSPLSYKEFKSLPPEYQAIKDRLCAMVQNKENIEGPSNHLNKDELEGWDDVK